MKLQCNLENIILQYTIFMELCNIRNTIQYSTILCYTILLPYYAILRCTYNIPYYAVLCYTDLSSERSDLPIGPGV